MKKQLILLGLLILIMSLVGCDFKLTTSTASTNTTEITDATDTSVQTTTLLTDATTDTITDITTSGNTTITDTTIPTTTTQSSTIEPTTTLSNYAQLNPGNDTVEINTDWIDAGAIVNIADNQYEMISSGTVDVTTAGTYLIEYIYENYMIQRMVIVVDTISPVITLNPGVDTIHIGETWVDGGVQVTDNSLGQITIEISGLVDSLLTGTYVVTYIATDESGNSSRLSRYVTVID